MKRSEINDVVTPKLVQRERTEFKSSVVLMSALEVRHSRGISFHYSQVSLLNEVSYRKNFSCRNY